MSLALILLLAFTVGLIYAGDESEWNVGFVPLAFIVVIVFFNLHDSAHWHWSYWLSVVVAGVVGLFLGIRHGIETDGELLPITRWAVLVPIAALICLFLR